MIYINKKVLASILALGVIISVGYFSSSYVLAGEVPTTHDTLIERIAQKFNLNKSDVEAVFTAVRDEKMEEMKARKEERLSQAVKDGVITEAQKKLILDHVGKRISKQWFSDNGIDETKLRSYLGFGVRDGRRMGR